eukprot:g42330.t1
MFLVEKALDAQRMADNHDVQGFFCAVKTTYGSNTQGPTALLAKDRVTLIQDKEAIKQRWGEHFRDLLNLGTGQHHGSHATCHKLSNTPAGYKVEKAICQLKNNKAAGANGIPAETLKCRGKELLLQLHALVCFIWKKDGILGELRDTTVLHDVMEVMAMTNVSINDLFSVQTIVKQGCIIAPILFSIYLPAMLHLITNKLPAGVELTYRTCAKLFTLYHLQAKTKVSPNSVIELWYVADACVCATSENVLETTVSTLTEAHESLGLTPNIHKAKVLHQSGVALWKEPLIIKVHREALENIGHFQHFGECTNSSVLDRANIPSLDWLQWAGHIVRMTNMRLPKQVLYSQLRNG